jgi:HK97 family phage portal protein
MSLLNRMTAAWNILTRQAPPGPADDPVTWWNFWRGGGYGGGGGVTGLPVSAKGALSVPVYTACISLISQSLAAENWDVVQESDDGGGTVQVENEADALLDALDFTHKERFVSSALHSGNGFLHNANGQLIALPWENMTLQWGPGMAPVYRYFDPMSGGVTEFAPDDLCHLRYRNWGRFPWVGLPPMVAVADAIGLGIAARILQATEFQNGTRLQGFLSTDHKLDRQRAQELAARWHEAYAGADRSGKTAVLEQGLTYQALEIKNLASLQMAELAKSNDADIARAFNVPLQVVGEVVQNRANAEEATRLLVMTCLQPMSRRVCDALGLYLLSPLERAQGIRMDISLRDLTKGHGVELSDALSKLVLAGIISRNEARSDLGLVATPEGAELLVPVNMQTVSQSDQRLAAVAPQAPQLQGENVVALPRSFRKALGR